MAGLLCRDDMDDVRARLTTWWHGGDIGRPVMLLTAPRDEPLETVEAIPRPDGWVTDYAARNFDLRVNISARACARSHLLGEAVPAVAPDLGPDCLALYLGCTGIEMPGTVWFKPFIDDPDSDGFGYDRDNSYWDFTLRLTRAQLEAGRGRFLLQFPDLIEGLDTLAAMRGTENLLIDLVERPEWVHDCMRRITDLYFRYYDVLYDMMHDEVGGSIFWVWGPGRTAKMQCDFSAMISPAMFGDFMVPVLAEMCERIGYCMYHWDGPDAVCHHDHLLSIPGLQVLQWTPGSGVEPPEHPRWWPMYHKTIEAGKCIFTHPSPAGIGAMKREFGEKLKRFILTTSAPSLSDAEEILKRAEL